jgi:hypothetical protein
MKAATKISIALLFGSGLILAGCNPAGAIPTSQPAEIEPQKTTAVVSNPTSTGTMVAAAPSQTGDSTETPQIAQNPVIPTRQNELADKEYNWNQLLLPDDILPIYEPEFAAADQALYSDDELVIGVEINGEAKAYSIGVLNRREMVNDTVGGTPVLVTW